MPRHIVTGHICNMAHLADADFYTDTPIPTPVHRQTLYAHSYTTHMADTEVYTGHSMTGGHSFGDAAASTSSAAGGCSSI
jgi:hypothetical protein